MHCINRRFPIGVWCQTGCGVFVAHFQAGCLQSFISYLYFWAAGFTSLGPHSNSSAAGTSSYSSALSFGWHSADVLPVSVGTMMFAFQKIADNYINRYIHISTNSIIDKLNDFSCAFIGQTYLTLTYSFDSCLRVVFPRKFSPSCITSFCLNPAYFLNNDWIDQPLLRVFGKQHLVNSWSMELLFDQLISISVQLYLYSRNFYLSWILKY